MSKMDVVLWGPKVLGRDKLDGRRWAYAIEAPFDMPANIPDLVGMKVQLEGGEFSIGGIVPKMPPGPIRRGETIELLVVAWTDPHSKNPDRTIRTAEGSHYDRRAIPPSGGAGLSRMG
jgi:hypothetical protein